MVWTISNLGKSVAYHIELHLKGGVMWNEQKSQVETRSIGDIAPGATETAESALAVDNYVADLVPKGTNEDLMGGFVIRTELSYVDEATGETLGEKQCWEGSPHGAGKIDYPQLNPCKEHVLVPLDQATQHKK